MRLKWSMSSSSSAGGRCPAAAPPSAAASSSFRWRRLKTPVSASVRARWSASRRASSSASASRAGGADGGLQHALERHLARHVGGDAVHGDDAVGRAGQARNDTQRVAPSSPMMRTESSVDSPFESRTRWRS